MIESCLRKKPRERLQAIGDARVLLEQYLGDPGSFATAAVPAAMAPGARRSILPWAVAGMLAAALIGAVAILGPEPPVESRPRRLSLLLPEGQELFRGYSTSAVQALSGGRNLVDDGR